MTIVVDTGNAIGGAFAELYFDIMTALPGLIAAILILVLGYLVGALLGHVLKRILDKTKIVSIIVKKAGLQSEVGKWNINYFLGLITKWYVFIIFLNPAAQVVKLDMLSQFFQAVALWVPNIILAIVIAMAGYVLSEYIGQKIQETRGKKGSSLASAAKLVTMVFVVLIALKQIGIELLVAETAFLIVLGGVMLALAISFGLGFKEEASKILKDLRKKL
ncbi:hypothetical protein GOV09_03215 [Candidatus Woesearchaeota archaeon]|nr:hypothetical protein [Candidatus Woesearchaeota archaeon]